MSQGRTTLPSWRRARAILALLATLAGAALPFTARASESCQLAVTVEGVPDGPALAAKLEALAAREGACDASTWALRISGAPRGQYIVALWNGADLETRWATNRGEVEVVASLLLRVALQKRAAVAAAVSSSPPSPPASSEPSPEPPAGSAVPPPSTTLPGAPPAPPAVAVGLVPGFIVAGQAGAGPEVAIGALVMGSYLRGGLMLRYGHASASGRSRSEASASAVGMGGTFVSPSVWLGGFASLGLAMERTSATNAGATSEGRATGLLVSAGPIAFFGLGAGWHLSTAIDLRWSTANATPESATVTTVVDKTNPGQGKGKPPTGTTTTSTTAVEPASQDAVDALGGSGVAATLGVWRAF